MTEKICVSLTMADFIGCSRNVALKEVAEEVVRQAAQSQKATADVKTLSGSEETAAASAVVDKVRATYGDQPADVVKTCAKDVLESGPLPDRPNPLDKNP